MSEILTNNESEKKGIEEFYNLRLTADEHNNHPFFDKPNYRDSEYVVFEKGNEQIMLLGVPHIDSIDHSIVNVIREKIDSYKPDIIFYEGGSRESVNRLRQAPIDHVAQLNEFKIVREMGEPGLVAKLAKEREIEFDSPEPNREAEIKNSLDKGHALSDILSYYMFRSMKNFKGNESEEYILKKMHYIESDFVKSGYAEDDIKSLMKDIVKNHFPIGSYRSFFNACTSPMETEDFSGKNISAVAWETSSYRDFYILRAIEKVLKGKKRLLVIFGRSHILMIEKIVRAYVNQ